MRKVERLALAVGALLVMVAIASTTLAVARKPPITAATIKAESEILAIHYKALDLYMATRAERQQDDTDEDTPWWLDLLMPAAPVADPEAASAEQAEESWEDPIEQVKQEFISSLQADLGLKNIRSIEKPQRRELHGVKRLKREFPKATILDFITTSVTVFPFNPFGSRYRFVYKAEARLIQPEASRVVWSAKCRYMGKARRLETFARDNGALLKTELESAAQECVETLYSAFLDKIE